MHLLSRGHFRGLNQVSKYTHSMCVKLCRIFYGSQILQPKCGMAYSQGEPKVILASSTSMFRDKLSTLSVLWTAVCLCVCWPPVSLSAHVDIVRYVSCSCQAASSGMDPGRAGTWELWSKTVLKAAKRWKDSPSVICLQEWDTAAAEHSHPLSALTHSSTKTKPMFDTEPVTQLLTVRIIYMLIFIYVLLKADGKPLLSAWLLSSNLGAMLCQTTSNLFKLWLVASLPRRAWLLISANIFFLKDTLNFKASIVRLGEG